MSHFSRRQRAALPTLRKGFASCSAVFLTLGMASASFEAVASVSISPGSWTGRAFRLRDRERIDGVERAFAVFPHGADWTVRAQAATEFDARIWSREDQGAGVEMFTHRSGGEKAAWSEEKRVVLREGDELNSAAWYSLAKAPGPREVEESGAVIFDSDGWSGVSRCRDDGRDSGRICDTATPLLCDRLTDNGFQIGEDELESVQKAEVRAISLVLAMRGPDHQLDNLVRFGNRMGLKDAMQTTKGRLLRVSENPEFARQLRALCAEVEGEPSKR